MGAGRIGIDIGGSKTELAVLDSQNEVVYRERRPTPQNPSPGTYERFVDQIRAMTVKAVAETGLNSDFTVGIGIPGALVGTPPRAKNTSLAWLVDRPFGEDLVSAMGRPVSIANDATCFTLSEAVDGAGAGYGLVFGVILGTGVGGGLAFEGRPWPGPNQLAGEWGHNPYPVRSPAEIRALISRTGPLDSCFCGHELCVERVLQGASLSRRYVQASGGTDRLAATEIATRFDRGDAVAARVIEGYARDLARALATIVNTIDPGVIVLGGGLSGIEALYPAVNAQLIDFVFHRGSPLTRPRVNVVQNRWGGSGGVRGAAWLGHAGHSKDRV